MPTRNLLKSTRKANDVSRPADADGSRGDGRVRDPGDATKTARAVGRPVAIGLGLIALLALLVAAFTWPPSDLGPRNLPLVVAGPPAATGPVKAQLAAHAGKDAFDITTVANKTAAQDAIKHRDAYGAVVADPRHPEVLIASAASAQVGQMLTQLGQAMGQAGGAKVTVHDVVPAPEDDPRGLVFGSGALPLVIGGIMLGAATSLALGRKRNRAIVAVGVAVGGGLAMTAIIQYGFDALGGHYLANAGIVALALLAVALPIIGLRHLIGPVGIALIALVVLLVGNPLSGITSAPELLPLGWLGQYLPPGAAGSALRGEAFFDGEGSGAPLLVLAVWAFAGHLLTLVPKREPQHVEQPKSAG